MEVRTDHEGQIQKLYEASMRGYVATLSTMIERCPEILREVSVLTSMAETPLHISALLGHVELTKLLLRLKPQLVTQLDSFKRSPLHLASAEGHRKIVKELLKANTDVCLKADQDGRIPLHLAAMGGRVEVIPELIKAKPESITVKVHGDTVLHLCVRYNRLDALKILMNPLINNGDFLNSTDSEGITIFLLSVMLNQFETTRYLLSQAPRIRVDVYSLITALENRHLSDVRNGTTENNLQYLQALLGRTDAIQGTQSTTSTAHTSMLTNLRGLPGSLQSKFNKYFGYQSDGYEETRGHLIVVATLIAQMSFQVATNPPGGYWQSDTNKVDHPGCPDDTCKAGTSILSYSGKANYGMFITCSTLSFVASLAVILLLVSRVPLSNKVSVGILVSGIWSSVILIAATYVFSMNLVQGRNDKIFYNIFSYAPMLLGGLIFFLVLFHIVRFCFWLIMEKLLTQRFGFLDSPVKKLSNWISNKLPRDQTHKDPGNAV